MTAFETAIPLRVVHPAAEEGSYDDGFCDDVLAGLSAQPKSIPSKHLYDKQGSELFDQICDLREYYVTRCELEIMQRHAGQMARALGAGVRLVELGSGSSTKTRLLLDQLESPAAYLPVDVSQQHLSQSCNRLQRDYPDLKIEPICADFTQEFSLPRASRAARTAVYFPGSTIGNFQHHQAKALLRGVHSLCGRGGELLIGIDLQKSPSVIHDAYNDAQGVTAEFNLNLLRRMNRELGADFDLDAFDYHAQYNQQAGRIEASLVSTRRQVVSLLGEQFLLSAGEAIRTEYSHKYTIGQFQRLAAAARFELCDVWSDPKDYFAVLLMRAGD